MSNELAKYRSPTVPALAMNEYELISVLQNSVYPGAKIESIKLVIGACKATGKDPLKKPYHIVPMPVSTGKKSSDGWDIKEMRDVIMPGINDYRTDASRTGEHIGTSEPEFGPDVTETLDGVTVTYPAWCRVSVQRQFFGGVIGTFSAVERWKENYATKSGKSDAPNAMWKRRPYAQLAKCAEAQALRKGFPEVGNHATAEEMEGKEIYCGIADVVLDDPETEKPKTKTQAFKARIGAKKETPPAVTLKDVLKSFANAGTVEALSAAAEMAKHLESSEDQSEARKAYKVRLDAIRKMQGSANVQGPTYAEIADMITNASDMDTLSTAADLIGSIDDSGQRTDLAKLYDDKRKEMVAE